jgi:hypothetical protein
MLLRGEVRRVKPSDDGKFLDLAVLEDGAANSINVWSFADVEGAAQLQQGDFVELDVFASAKLSKAGRAYLSCQLRKITPPPAAKPVQAVKAG